MKHSGHLLGDFFIRSRHLINVLLIGILHLVEQSTPASFVSLISAAQVKSDAARVFEKPTQRLCIPLAVVWLEELVAAEVHSRSVGEEHGLAGFLMPLVEVFDRIAEVLERDHVDERFSGVHHFHRDRRVGFVAVAEQQVVFVVATNGVVGGLVVAGRQLAEFFSSRLCLQSLGIEDRTAPFVVWPVVSPCRTVAVEIADEVSFIGQFSAV